MSVYRNPRNFGNRTLFAGEEANRERVSVDSVVLDEVIEGPVDFCPRIFAAESNPVPEAALGRP